MCVCVQNKDKEGVMYLKHPLPAMGKFVQSGDQMKKPYERDYYSKDNGRSGTLCIVIVPIINCL